MGYWETRQAEMYQAGEMQVNQYFARLEKAFNQTKRELQKTIEAFYFRYAKENGLSYAEAQKRLDKEELGELKDFIDLAMQNIGKYNQTVNNMSIKARITRYQALEAEVDAILRQLYAVDYESMAEETMREVYEESYYRTWYNIDQYRGFHAAFSKVEPRTVETLLEYPFNGANFSSRLWKQKDHLQTQLMESLTTMMIQGKHPGTLAKDFAKKMQSKKFDAYRLLHTESSFLMSEATHAGYKEDGVEKYQILATLDSKTCGVCGELDGDVHEVDKAVVGVNMPPFHPLCRCTDTPYYDGMDLSDMPRVARDPETGKTYDVPGDMTYKEWKERFLNDTGSGKKKKRSKTGLQAAGEEALALTEKYSTRKSKWSGRIVVDDNKCRKEHVAGRKLWNCDILLKSTAVDKTVIHEQLHARSGSYMNPITIIPHSNMEEASVELLAREICRAEGIPFQDSLNVRVDALRKINAIAGIYEKDLDFAVALFAKDIRRRDQWLERQVEKHSGEHLEDQEQLRKLLDLVKGMKK